MMWIRNIRWKPVRLDVRRVSPRHYKLYRDGKGVGEITRNRWGKWIKTEPGQRFDYGTVCSSWRTAILHLARLSLYADVEVSRRKLDVVRVRVAGHYFQVVFYPDNPMILEEAIDHPQTDFEQAVLRKAVNAATKAEQT